MQITTTLRSLECTECAAALEADIRFPGEIIDCDDCSAELEVISLEPLQVQLAPEVEEDWGE